MKPREPLVEVLGPLALHDQRCAVLPGESAVLYMNDGVFHPSWKAQIDGWHLVRATTRVQRFILRYMFGVRNS